MKWSCHPTMTWLPWRRNRNQNLGPIKRNPGMELLTIFLEIACKDTVVEYQRRMALPTSSITTSNAHKLRKDPYQVRIQNQVRYQFERIQTIAIKLISHMVRIRSWFVGRFVQVEEQHCSSIIEVHCSSYLILFSYSG